MNAARRKEIEKAIKRLETLKEQINDLRGEIEVGIKSDEETYLESMPENMQGSDKAEKSQAAIDSLDVAINHLDEVENYIDNSIEQLTEAAQ